VARLAFSCHTVYAAFLLIFPSLIFLTFLPPYSGIEFALDICSTLSWRALQEVPESRRESSIFLSVYFSLPPSRRPFGPERPPPLQS
jgi:hypothetical protein